MTEDQAKQIAPQAYTKILNDVKPERDQNPRDSYKENWWIFAEPRPGLRKAVARLARYIVTPNTAKHRPFLFLDANVIPDTTVYAVASDDAFTLGVLSSQIHLTWARYAGGTLQDRPRYNSDRTFLPYPFPDASDEALKQRIRDAAEKLDGLRKQVLDRHPDLTLTKLFNTLEALRAAEAAGGVLSDKERDIAERGCVSLIRQYHDAIDVAVAEAYGWGDLLVSSPLPPKGGDSGVGGAAEGSMPEAELRSAPTPSPSLAGRGGPWDEGADEPILERLVALNKERAAEEARGIVRWLRPEYQAPGYVAPVEQEELALPEEQAKAAEVLEWPAKLPEQVVAVAAIVERAGKPVAANDVAKALKGKRAGTVAPVLDALAGMGRLRKLGDGRFAA